MAEGEGVSRRRSIWQGGDSARDDVRGLRQTSAQTQTLDHIQALVRSIRFANIGRDNQVISYLTSYKQSKPGAKLMMKGFLVC